MVYLCVLESLVLNSLHASVCECVYEFLCGSRSCRRQPLHDVKLLLWPIQKRNEHMYVCMCMCVVYVCVCVCIGEFVVLLCV